MRIVFSLLGLLIVVAIIGSIAKRQLQVLAPAAGASAAAPALQPRQLPQKVADDVAKALAQGVQRGASEP